MYDIEARLHEARAEQLAHGHDWDVADVLPVVKEIVNDVLAELSDAVNERGQWKGLHMTSRDKQEVASRSFTLAMAHVHEAAGPYGGGWHSQYAMRKHLED